MKTKYTIFVFLIGFILTTIGALLKIMHWPFSNILLILGTTFKVIGVIAFVSKLLKYDKFKDFFESK